MKAAMWFTILSTSLFTISCSDDEFPVRLDEYQVERLLTGGSTKTWKPLSEPLFEPCEFDNLHSFTKPGKNLDYGYL